ncbi:MAG: hypothetical protein R2844_17905 [Caldilineales bacterium]
MARSVQLACTGVFAGAATRRTAGVVVTGQQAGDVLALVVLLVRHGPVQLAPASYEKNMPVLCHPRFAVGVYLDLADGLVLGRLARRLLVEAVEHRRPALPQVAPWSLLFSTPAAPKVGAQVAGPPA